MPIQVFALKRLNKIESREAGPPHLDPSFNRRHDFGILINLSNSILHKMECEKIMQVHSVHSHP